MRCALRAVNAKLAESLAEADRTIAALREQGLGGEPTAEDWERMAQVGAVRARVPCMRDKL